VKTAKNQKKPLANTKVAPFVKRAERAFKRVAKQVEMDYRAKNLTPAVWGE
jgi:hypothetical protein